MIKIKESHLILIILLSILTSYSFYTYFLDNSINCKINYFKYNNYHTNKKKDDIYTEVNSVVKKDENNNTYVYDDNSTLDASAINYNGDDDMYIKKMFTGL